MNLAEGEDPDLPAVAAAEGVVRRWGRRRAGSAPLRAAGPPGWTAGGAALVPPPPPRPEVGAALEAAG